MHGVAEKETQPARPDGGAGHGPLRALALARQPSHYLQRGLAHLTGLPALPDLGPIHAVKISDPGRPQTSAQPALHGRHFSNPLQSPDASLLRAPPRQRQAAQGRHRRRHAQADHARQRLAPRRPRMAARTPGPRGRLMTCAALSRTPGGASSRGLRPVTTSVPSSTAKVAREPFPAGNPLDK